MSNRFDSFSIQHRVFKKILPETEVNFTQGEHSGHTSVYLTPGVVFGEFHIKDRPGFTAGFGCEVAVTSLHPTNLIPIFSVRFPPGSAIER
jgi:hypothetical protein